MEETKLISVIVPVYNAAAFLPRCLASLLGQTYGNLEIICVDDGSTDNSLEMLKQYASQDSRIKVIHQENAGVSVARNRGMEVARGEYVTFVDADDWLEEGTYEKVLAVFSEDVDMVCYSAVVDGSVPAEKKEIMQEYSNLKHRGIQSASACILRTNVFVWNKVFRKSIIDKYGVHFPIGIACGEDAAFYFCYAAVVGVAYYMPARLYHYVQHGQSAMAHFRELSAKGMDHLRVMEYVYDFYERYGLVNKHSFLFERLFDAYYDLSLQFTPQEMHADVHRMAYVLAVKSGVIHKKRLPQIRLLKGMFMPTMEKFFHWFTDNRECFGVLGRSIYSITYGEKCTVHRMMGKVIKKVPVEEFA